MAAAIDGGGGGGVFHLRLPGGSGDNPAMRAVEIVTRYSQLGIFAASAVEFGQGDQKAAAKGGLLRTADRPVPCRFSMVYAHKRKLHAGCCSCRRRARRKPRFKRDTLELAATQIFDVDGGDYTNSPRAEGLNAALSDGHHFVVVYASPGTW